MSGSHHALAPLSLPPHLAAEGWQLKQPYDESTRYDLRTLPERNADELAQMALRLDNLLDAVENLTHRVQHLEAKNTALDETR